MIVNRRSILRSLLAAPVVITTPGLLMSVRAFPRAQRFKISGFDQYNQPMTEYLIVSATERYSFGYVDPLALRVLTGEDISAEIAARRVRLVNAGLIS